MTAKITYTQLAQLGTCEEQLEVFLNLFPTGEVEVTEELCVEHAERFDWQWAARQLLTRRGFQSYYGAGSPDAFDAFARRQELLGEIYTALSEGGPSSARSAVARRAHRQACARDFAQIFLEENV